VKSLWFLDRGGVRKFAFQLGAHIGLLKGTPNAIKSVWEGSHFATYCPQPRLAMGVAGACKMGPEPKEGGKVKLQEIVLGMPR